MRDVFNEIVSFLSFNHILAVFLLSLLIGMFMMICRKVRTGANGLIVYSVISSVLLLLLPTAFLMRKFQTVFFTYTTLWVMVPVIPVTAFCLTAGIPEIMKLKKSTRIITFILIVCLLLCCGNMGKLSKSGKELPNLKEEEITIGDCIPILQRLDEIAVSAASEGDDFVFLAPPSITEYARQYSGNIKMLYGRDIWDGSLAAYNYNSYSEECLSLYNWMLYSDAYGCLYYGDAVITENFNYEGLDYDLLDAEGKLHGGPAYAEAAKSLGVDAIVFTVNEKTDRAALDHIENVLSAHSEYVEVDSPVSQGYLIMYL